MLFVLDYPGGASSIWRCCRVSVKISRLLRRVAGVRHILTTESRLPASIAKVISGLRAVAPILETRSARRTVGRHTTQLQEPERSVRAHAREVTATRPTAGVGRSKTGEQQGGTDSNPRTSPEQSSGTRRTRETYGGTEDPHQAQGL